MTFRSMFLAAVLGVVAPLSLRAQSATPVREMASQEAAPQKTKGPADAEEQEESEVDSQTKEKVKAPDPPDGLLPVSELKRIEYAPRDRPKPLLHGNVLLVVSESGFVDGYDAESGEFAWKLGLPGEKLFDPVVFVPIDSANASGETFKILLSEPSGHWLIIDGPTGEIDREGRLAFELALPPVRGPRDVLFLATPSGDILGYDVTRREVVFQTATGERPLALAATESLLVVSGGDQTLTALDLPNGNLRWTFRGRAAFHAPAAFGREGRRVVIGDDTGELYAFDARTGKIKFRWSTGAAIRNRVLIEDKRMYVATYANTVYAYNASSGDEHWRANLPGRPATAPLRVNKRLMVGTFDGSLVEINPQRGNVGKQYTAPGEIVHAPSFYLARPEPGWLAAQEEVQEDEDEAALPELAALPRLTEEEQPEQEQEREQDGLDADLPETEVTPLREPLWFERSRIALALRSGEVLLLHHQVPGKTAPGDKGKKAEPDEEDSETAPGRRGRPPKDANVPF